jgi:speckle-type POZ protein
VEQSRTKQNHVGFVQAFKTMFATNELADFVIKTNDGEAIKCHKAIILARSPVFHSMLMTDMSEKTTNCVEIFDFDSKTIRELLRFLYCEEVKDLKEIVCSLIYAAEKYQVEELKTICIDQILKDLSKSNVIQALMVADQIVTGTDRIVEACVEILQR